jgi:hypothetical protein
LSAANYWFRHALELAWPLYPAFILTSSLSGIATPRLVLLNLYAVPVLVILGLVFVFGKAKQPAASPDTTAEGMIRSLPAAQRSARAITGFAPLVIVIGTFLALDAVWRIAGAVLGLSPAVHALAGRFGPVMTGLLAGCIHVVLHAEQPGCFKGTLNFGTLKLAGVIAGIRVFSALLSAGNVAAASAAELAAVGVSPILAAAILPFVAGLVTGVGFGYVGLAFPILMGLFPYSGGDLPREAAVVLAGAFGYAGMMLSPLHVCMVVTAEHFRIGLAATMRRFIVPLSLFVLVAVSYVALLARILSIAGS